MRRWCVVVGLVLAVAGAATEAEKAYEAGQKAMGADDLRTAVRSFREAVGLAPEQDGYQTALVLALVSADRLVEAEQAVRAALVKLPDHPELLRWQIDLLLELERAKEAVEPARKMVKLKPDDAAATALLGETLTEAGQAAEAIPLLRRTALQLPEAARPAALYDFGRGLATQERPAEAAVAFEDCLALDAKRRDARRRLVELYAKATNWAEVERQAKLWLAADAKDAEALLAQARAEAAIRPSADSRAGLAEALLVAGQYREAYDLWRQMCAPPADPPPATWLLARGSEFQEAGRHELAELAARAAVAAEPGPAAHLALARALLGEHLPDEAEAEARKSGAAGQPVLTAAAALRQNWSAATDSDAVAKARAAQQAKPDDATLRNELAVALYRASRFAESECWVRRALQPYQLGHAVLLGNLGDTLRRLGRYEAAAIALEQSVALDDRNVLAINLLGQTLLALGRPNAAAEQFRRAARLSDKPAGYLANLGDALHEDGRLGLAEVYARQAVDQAPTGWRVNRLANVLYDQERFEETVDLYRQAIELEPKVAVYYANLAGSLLRLGRRDEALVEARKAVEHGCTRESHWAIKQLGL